MLKRFSEDYQIELKSLDGVEAILDPEEQRQLDEEASQLRQDVASVGEINMAALADPMATTVVYMGKRTFPGLVQRLIEAGLPPSTPAMLAEAVSTPAERVTRFTIESLATHLEETTSSTPALIFYGPLAELDP